MMAMEHLVRFIARYSDITPADHGTCAIATCFSTWRCNEFSRTDRRISILDGHAKNFRRLDKVRRRLAATRTCYNLRVDRGLGWALRSVVVQTRRRRKPREGQVPGGSRRFASQAFAERPSRRLVLRFTKRLF